MRERQCSHAQSAAIAYTRMAACAVPHASFYVPKDRPMARVRFIDTADTDEGKQLLDDIRRRRGGSLLNLDKVLMHSVPLARGWNQFMGAVRRQTALDPALREMAILRVAVLNDAPYEFMQHAPDARSAGVSDAKIEGLKQATVDPAVFGVLEQQVLACADAMTRTIRVPHAVFAPLRDALGDAQMVELTLTIASYNMVSRFLEALEIEAE